MKLYTFFLSTTLTASFTKEVKVKITNFYQGLYDNPDSQPFLYFTTDAIAANNMRKSLNKAT